MRFGRALIAASFYALVDFVAGQTSSQICDSANGICFEGYQDPDLDIFVGFVLPPLTTPPATEYIVQLVAPLSYGYTGASMAGTMADSLLFVFWPDGDDVIFSTRWTDGYVQPLPYSGPTITMLPGSGTNSTHIKATFRCQNCTNWSEGSIDPTGTFQLIAYVAQTETPVDDISNPASNFTEHNDFSFFGLQTNEAISNNYQSYLSGAASSASSAPGTSAPHTSSTPHTTVTPTTPLPAPTPTTSASGATQTKYGQCGGTGWSGPTACAAGSTCTAVSPPYYSQCL